MPEHGKRATQVGFRLWTKERFSDAPRPVNPPISVEQQLEHLNDSTNLVPSGHEAIARDQVVAERYLDGDVALHLHMRITSWFAPVYADELVKEVIKRRSQVLESITDDERPPERGFLVDGDAQDVLAIFGVELSPRLVSVTLNEGVRFVIQSMQMLVCPPELAPDAFKRVRHELTSPRMAVRKQRRTQKTCPKKGEPIEIPIPKRRDVLRDLDKLTQPEKRPDKGRR